MVGDRALIEFRLSVVGCQPTKSYDGDAGWDLYVAKRTVLRPFEPVDIPCGFDIALPAGYWARIAARSSSSRKHQILINEAVIDAGYRGPMFVCMTYIGTGKYVLEQKWRLAQLLLHRIEPVEWSLVDSLSASERGSKGFGSSGT